MATSPQNPNDTPAVAPEPGFAPKIILAGESGSGKTTSLATFLEAGLEVFMVATEYPDVLGHTDPQKFHWHYIPAASSTWASLKESGRQINSFANDALQKLPGINKEKNQQMLQVLDTLANFKCDRTGQAFGDASKWGSDRVLVVDSLSGLSILARNLAVGEKPILTQPDWGIMMQYTETLLNTIAMNLRCWVVLTAHLEREVDEVSGGVQIMVSTLGRKLAPRIPRFFSDVVHVKRVGKEYSWSTITPNFALKTRNFPMEDKLPQSFGPLVAKWRKDNPGK